MDGHLVGRPLLGLLGLLGLLAANAAVAQLSPGKLSQVHAGLEGSTGCLQCHARRQGVAPQRCLECHTALRESLDKGRGLHARAGYESCETCHIEHHGREFELIFWGDEGRDAFDHRLTGWPLQGAHGEAACRACHQPDNLRDSPLLKRGGADPETTFLGLTTACLSCHQDEHRDQLGTSCQDCHGMESWKPAPGFDHGETSFPLSQRHQRLACGACHPTEKVPQSTGNAGSDSSFLRFANLPHSSCANCHQDPHQGRLGAQCADCHSPSGWSRVDSASFDHGRTRFPLRGRHLSLPCTSCHQGGPSTPKTATRTTTNLAFDSCADCHQDPHLGRLGATCAGCHDPSGWSAVDRGAFDHDRTRFPLQGEHRTVACADCHASGSATKPLSFGTCGDCHDDPHLGQLANSAGRSACRDCHTVAGFTPSTFTLKDHQETPFPLRGAHQAVACVDCHIQAEPEALPKDLRMVSRRHKKSAPTTVTRFRFASTACLACHGNPHSPPHGDSQKGETTANIGTCDTCHSPESWTRIDFRGTEAFDHGTTGFPLDGAHGAVPCAQCHAPNQSEGPPAFASRSTACADCHDDLHFEGQTAIACADCHTTSRWGDTTFDHQRDAGFPLDGAHQRLICADCHQRLSEETSPPTTCEGCHGGSVISPSSGRR